MKSELINKVSNILRQVAGEVILPAFHQDVVAASWEKTPGEVVTVIDGLLERRIAQELKALLPGTLVIGEEACAAQPDLLQRLGDDTVWLLDPLDGTRNFAAGRRPFAVMLTLLENGRPSAAWILDPLTAELVVAERGAGTWRGEQRLWCRAEARTLDQVTAIVSDTFVPPLQTPLLNTVRDRLREVRPTQRCAGAEYPLLAAGEIDLILYWRTLPWDHAAGTLLVEEAGGIVRQIDGTAYELSQAKAGLISAANEEIMTELLGLSAEQTLR